jgi:hypothetical protein
LNGTINFHSYVLLAAVVFYFPYHFVNNVVQGCSAGVLFVTEKSNRGVLVGYIELLVDVGVSLLY